MSTLVNNIIRIVQERLLELHPKPKNDCGIKFSLSRIEPEEPQKLPPDIQFSVRHTYTPKAPSPPPPKPYVESPLPPWAQTLLGRLGIRKDERILPDLNAVNPSFAARILIAVRDQFHGNAVPLYTAAHIDRRLYSKIISDEKRPVSRDTALAFAFALRLNPHKAQELLQSAGHALSPTCDRDIVLTACFENNLFDINEINKILIHFHLPRL